MEASVQITDESRAYDALQRAKLSLAAAEMCGWPDWMLAGARDALYDAHEAYLAITAVIAPPVVAEIAATVQPVGGE
jgi:hypothetical protein